MPNYDFKCTKCKQVFELSISISQKTDASYPKNCPKCKSSDVKAIFTSGHGGVISSKSSSCESFSNCSECCAGSACNRTF